MTKKLPQLFLFSILSFCPFKGFAQSLEHEISAGPQTTKAIIRDYTVGIIGNNKPLSDRLLVGYTFNWSVRTKPTRFQPGLQVKSDLGKYNVYIPVEFPSDFMEEKQSRLDYIYTAYRIGAGAMLRIHLGNVFLQPGLSYLIDLSSNTKHQAYIASLDQTEEIDGEEYTSGGGVAGELQVGLKFGKGPNKKFGLALGAQYLLKEQSYTDEQFAQHWEIQSVDFFMLMSYRFSKTE